MEEAERKAAAMLKRIASGDVPDGGGTLFTYKDPPPPKEEADAQTEKFVERVSLRAERRKGAIC